MLVKGATGVEFCGDCVYHIISIGIRAKRQFHQIQIVRERLRSRVIMKIPNDYGLFINNFLEKSKKNWITQDNRSMGYIDMNSAATTQFTLLVTAHALSMSHNRANICMNWADSQGQFHQKDQISMKLELSKQIPVNMHLILISFQNNHFCINKAID